MLPIVCTPPNSQMCGIAQWVDLAHSFRTNLGRISDERTDRQDAQLWLQFPVENRFPRIWVTDAENRDLQQMPWHHHRLVQMRTRVMNQLRVGALNKGVRCKKGL
jgi:transposase